MCTPALTHKLHCVIITYKFAMYTTLYMCNHYTQICHVHYTEHVNMLYLTYSQGEQYKSLPLLNISSSVFWPALA